MIMVHMYHKPNYSYSNSKKPFSPATFLTLPYLITEGLTCFFFFFFLSAFQLIANNAWDCTRISKDRTVFHQQVVRFR